MVTKRAKKPAGEHFTKLTRRLLEAPAWRALPTTAQAIYPILALEWHGPNANNNGRIVLSLRQAAKSIGLGSIDTAGRAFQALQAKGFIVVRSPAFLGVEGKAKATEYELTDLPVPGSGSNQGRRLYLQWQEGHDFPIARMPSNNPTGRNRAKQRSRPENHDEPIPKIGTVSRSPSLKS